MRGTVENCVTHIEEDEKKKRRSHACKTKRDFFLSFFVFFQIKIWFVLFVKTVCRADGHFLKMASLCSTRHAKRKWLAILIAFRFCFFEEKEILFKKGGYAEAMKLFFFLS